MGGDLTRRDFVVAVGGATAAAYAGQGAPAFAGGAERAGHNPLRYYYPLRRGRRRTIETDVCVYGATAGGVAAAVQAARMGKTVALAAFGRHLGGMSSSGLGATDAGNSASIGGLGREFYRRVGARYGQPASFRFEPHVAEAVFDEWAAEHGVRVFREQRLRRVRSDEGALTAIRMESNLVFRARMFIDASYEGDLMAAADVSYTVGREANAVYDETINGVQFRTTHQFRVPVDPYVVPGDPASGLLQGISPDPPGTPGEGDHRIQAYNFRLCLTRAADRLPFPRPRHYDPARYELLLRYIQAGVWELFGNNQPMPNGKTDMNNHGAVSTDNIGRNYRWPEGGYRERERIFQDHVTYQQGLLWFLANDERVPAEFREQVRAWGLPRDEFTETGGWPHELYIREGRRMVSDYVVTEHDCRGRTAVEDSVGLASYTMDSHNCKRVVVDGLARNEGDVQVGVPNPYRIPYRAIVPRESECRNLLVPVALSASHIAFGSARMEPVFMLLGHAAATAAAQAIDAGSSVQAVAYPPLRRRLLQDGMVLDWPPRAPLSIDAPELSPDVAAPVAVLLRNEEGAAVGDAALALAPPAGWAAVANGPTTFEEIAAGASVAVSWDVTAPVQPEPAAAADLRASSRYRVDGREVTLEATSRVYVVEPVGDAYRTAAAAPAHFGRRGDRLAVIAGGADLWQGTDQYGAIYRPAAVGTRATVTTKVVSQDATDPNARAGLMIRDDIFRPGRAPGYVVLAVKPVNGFLLLWDADGDGLVESVARAETGTTPYPAWLRLERDGTTYTGSYSTDGATWTTIGRAVVPQAAVLQDAGVFVTSHTSALGRGLFDGLRVEA